MPLRYLAPLAVLVVCATGRAQTTPGVDTAGSPKEAAATVNGEPIAVAELDAALAADLPSIPLTMADRRQLRAARLDDLIDDKLLKQVLAKHGPKVEPAEIDAQMTAFKAQLVKENRTLAEFLKETNQTEAQLRADWFAHARLAHYVKLQATDDQLKAFYAANKDHFDKTEVRVSQIVVRVAKSASAVDRAAAKEKLQAVRAELLAGKTTFAAAAMKVSQCPSALKGGDLGFIPRRGLPEDEPVAKAAFALKVGGLSEVVETDRGIHLLAATERKSGPPSTIEKCIVEVLEAYTEDVRLELVKKLRKEGQVRVTLP